MTEKEFESLSEKRKKLYTDEKISLETVDKLDLYHAIMRIIEEQDKEFIKKLRVRKVHDCETKDCSCFGGKDKNAVIISIKDLDKLAGPKLTK